MCMRSYRIFSSLVSFFAPIFHSLFDAIFLLVYCERASTYKWFRLNGNCFDIIDQFFTLAFPFSIPFQCSFHPFLRRLLAILASQPWSVFSDSNRTLGGFSVWKFPVSHYISNIHIEMHTTAHISKLMPILSLKAFPSTQQNVDSIPTNITTTKSSTMNWHLYFAYNFFSPFFSHFFFFIRDYFPAQMRPSSSNVCDYFFPCCTRHKCFAAATRCRHCAFRTPEISVLQSEFNTSIKLNWIEAIKFNLKLAYPDAIAAMCMHLMETSD